MIQEAYCSFEVARLLKEKRFNCPCRVVYSPKGIIKHYLKEEVYGHNLKGHKKLCPTHQLAMAWLREAHKVLIVIDAYHADHWEGYIDCFEINIYSNASTIIVPNEIAYHTDYTEAVEAALKYVLENLI